MISEGVDGGMQVSLPGMSPHDPVHRALRALHDAHPRVVLAVSGGLDSMVMLDAAAATRPALGSLIVATFDHGTGPHARAAARHVAREARARELEARVGRARLSGAGEAAWRDARWRFLRDLARETRSIVATAHTEDDQVETVAFRVMRGSGARGLAGLYAPSDVARPFLELRRSALERYARDHALRWVEDPSNASAAHARNRLRHEILPALARVAPELDAALLATARRARDWRRDVDAVAGQFVRSDATPLAPLVVDRDALARLDADSLAAVWPAIAARAGIALDRRGTLRLATFTITGRRGGRIQLSGNVEVCRRGDELVLGHRAPGDRVPTDGPTALQGARVEIGRWCFVRLDVDTPSVIASPLDRPDRAALDADAALEVRAWRPGDRMRSPRSSEARRVKRYLSEARIAVTERRGWPVVVADGEIVWIPGISRSDAATARSGRPKVLYACERFIG